jgi:hypothetical protein
MADIAAVEMDVILPLASLVTIKVVLESPRATSPAVEIDTPVGMGELF